MTPQTDDSDYILNGGSEVYTFKKCVSSWDGVPYIYVRQYIANINIFSDSKNVYAARSLWNSLTYSKFKRIK